MEEQTTIYLMWQVGQGMKTSKSFVEKYKDNSILDILINF